MGRQKAPPEGGVEVVVAAAVVVVAPCLRGGGGPSAACSCRRGLGETEKFTDWLVGCTLVGWLDNWSVGWLLC